MQYMPACQAAEIDRRLATGEPGKQVARDYDLNPSSLHRHRSNCLELGSSNAIMKEVARGTAAITCLPSKDDLNRPISSCGRRSTRSSVKRKQQGSLQIALSGLNSIRHTLDSLSRLAGYDRPAARRSTSRCKPMSMSICGTSLSGMIKKFDHEPELKARIAQALLEIDDEHAA